GGDVAEHTFGCRAAQFAVVRTIAESLKVEGSKDYTNIIVADPLCHYSTAIAAEMAGLQLVEPTNTGYPEYKVRTEDFVEKIEQVKSQSEKLPALLVLTHVEPYYGNLNPVKEVGKIAEDYGIPYMVNAAYTGGVMPVNMRDFKADFLTISAHKSMASLGPLGFLITSYEWGKKAFAPSTIKPDWTGRVFGKKIPNVFGCSVGGIPLISSMLSFPYVVERTKTWGEELKKIGWFIQEIENIQGIMIIGERPHNHHLIHLETPIFWEISKHHKRKGFFLAEEMEKHGFIGLHRGLSKHVKLSTYGLSSEGLTNLHDAFFDIVEKYTKEFNIKQ
ncbi:MAG: aminotransferase class V-fold PLP-dependent enzyme, partial [Euryarchaeota archaeon]|nr:aminotransferase class V-fold PLP-dependent enzyme [Euryarchaeota archaeon]